jgi:hypothetical protein
LGCHKHSFIWIGRPRKPNSGIGGASVSNRPTANSVSFVLTPIRVMLPYASSIWRWLCCWSISGSSCAVSLPAPSDAVPFAWRFTDSVWLASPPSYAARLRTPTELPCLSRFTRFNRFRDSLSLLVRTLPYSSCSLVVLYNDSSKTLNHVPC